MLKIKLPNKVEKTLKRIPARQQKQIFTKIEALCLDPEPRGSRIIRGGLAPYRRIKVGNYRVIYFVEDDTLHIVVIDKRNDERVYRQINRLS